MALKDYYQTANYMTKTMVPSPLGEPVTQWEVGMEFRAQLNTESTAEKALAAQLGLSETLAIRSTENLGLERDDRIKFNGSVYRVVSYGNLAQPPASISVFGGQLELLGV